ncbi:MAG: UDP-N-acetylmuramoyl-L-alanyl-D-glutamate--2,6-diaminopimelate ligase [Bryobacteraceae bacterium]
MPAQICYNQNPFIRGGHIHLTDLLRNLPYVIWGSDNPIIDRITSFSSNAGPGCVYVACDTPLVRGHSRVQEAIDRGASAVVVQRPIRHAQSSHCPIVVVANSFIAHATMCANYFCHPEKHLRVYAVTGTAGKTTTCHLLDSILRAGGMRVGLISSVYRRTTASRTASANTTPEPFELYGLLRTMAEEGITDVILEASSIGLAEERLWGLNCEGAIFTNLGRDHISYHGSISRYRAAKAKLFATFVPARRPRKVCAINIDDPFGAELARGEYGDMVPYSLNQHLPGIIRMTEHSSSVVGTIAGVSFRSDFFGEHNSANVLAAATLSHNLGLSANAIAEGISELRVVPGRLEAVRDIAYVDYAHTAESVAAALNAIRARFSQSPIVAVLGCGGGADKEKRPRMASAAFYLADVTIITSDNPRWEPPERIISDMIAGSDLHSLQRLGRLEIEPDRSKAINRAAAIARSRAGILVVLGKGSEAFQEIQDIRVPFRDQEVLECALASRS